MANNKKENTFEDNMKRLKTIVDLMEKEDVDLDKSIKLYEEGLSLSKQLKKQLEVFENKIEALSGDENE